MCREPVTTEFRLSPHASLPSPTDSTRSDSSIRGFWLKSLTSLGRANTDASSSPPRLSPRELRRRIWHMAPGFLAILSWAVPHDDPVSPTFQVIAVTIIVGLSAILALRYASVARHNERHGLSGILGYACSILTTLLLFPAHEELAMTVLAVLAFGDGSATLGGIAFRGPPLPWNAAKTWAGSASFLIIGAPVASLVYWAIAEPSVSLVTAALCGSTAAFVAAVAESLPFKLNDNIRVGFAAAVTVVLMHALFVGLD